jgi:hypothetical protein
VPSARQSSRWSDFAVAGAAALELPRHSVLETNAHGGVTGEGRALIGRIRDHVRIRRR